MPTPASEVVPAPTTPPTAAELPRGPLWPWATFLLPMVVYMLVGAWEPKPPEIKSPPDSERVGRVEEGEAEVMGQGASSFPFGYTAYPYVYTLKIALTMLTMALVWGGYRTFPWRVHGLSVVVGVVGVVVWIGLCQLRWEPQLIGPLDRWLGSFIPGLAEGEIPTVGLMGMLGTGERSAFNPLQELASTPRWAAVFLVIRFVGLACVVPIIEEFFLRGFLMRYVMHQRWWEIPVGTVNRTAVLVGTLVPMLMHPGELLAALVWFSMVTWLLVRTRNIWDCVIAHAVTNLLLGIYVVVWDQWQLM